MVVFCFTEVLILERFLFLLANCLAKQFVIICGDRNVATTGGERTHMYVGPQMHTRSGGGVKTHMHCLLTSFSFLPMVVLAGRPHFFLVVKGNRKDLVSASGARGHEGTNHYDVHVPRQVHEPPGCPLCLLSQ
jgi:hypothetical protein